MHHVVVSRTTGLLAAMMVLIGCACDRSGRTDQTRFNARMTATVAPTDPVVARFLRMTERMLLHKVRTLANAPSPQTAYANVSVADYLAWLALRPGTEPYAVRADPAGNSARVHIGRMRDGAFVVFAACEVGPEVVTTTPGPPVPPVPALTCPELWALWRDQAPAAAAAAQEMAPFVPYWFALPAVPPDGYALQSIRLATDPNDVGAYPLVVSAMYASPSGATATLMQQPWGMPRSFPEYQECSTFSPFLPNEGWQIIAGEEVRMKTREDGDRFHACAAWSGGAGSNLVLLVDEVSEAGRAAVIQQVVERLVHIP